jgi:hypothetical protein
MQDSGRTGRPPSRKLRAIIQAVVFAELGLAAR